MTTRLEMRGITKTFPGVRALGDVSLVAEQGEIHAICGENGAGKSTLMEVLSGGYTHGSYEGDIVFDGKPRALKGIRDSEDRGIIIHQDLALMEVSNGSVWHPEQSDRQGIKNVNLNVRKGEIAGLLGTGRTDLAMSIFGKSYGKGHQATVSMNDKVVVVSTVAKSIAAGISYVSADRKALGLILDEPFVRNVTLANPPGVSSRGILDKRRETQVAEDCRTQLAVRTPGVQQKVIKRSDIRTDRLVFLCFVSMGVVAALAGMEVTARLNSATPKAGTGIELDAIASVFIGGAAMAGGSGKIVGVVIGTLIMCDEHGHVDHGDRHRIPTDDQGPRPVDRRCL